MLVPALPLLALGPLAAAQVHTVDDTPGAGADFATIQAAIDAALDGDVILVAPGAYAAFVVDGKDLAIVSASGAVDVQGTSVVRNVAPGAQVFLRRLHLQGTDAPGLQVESCAGAVWIEQCAIEALDTPSLLPPAPGLALASAADVRVLRSAVAGEPGKDEFDYGGPAQDAAPGLRAQASALFVADSAIRGGDGGHAWILGWLDGGSGGAALQLSASSARAWGSTLTGGAGGLGDYCDCPGGTVCGVPGDGGHAILVESPPSGTVELLDTQLVPGAGGWTQYPGKCTDGAPGAPILGLPAGSIHAIDGAHRSLGSVAPAVEGGTAVVFLDGEPQDLALIATGAGLSPPLALGGATGTLWVGPAVHVLAAGAGDALNPWSPTVPPLPPGVEAVRVVVQGAVLTAGGEVRLLAPASLVLLDDAL